MSPEEPKASATAPGSFGSDVAFLSEHTRLVLLKSEDGQAQVAVAPAYQGRVMTSSAQGELGKSLGYVHRPGVELKEPAPHITVVGGEDRFWLGPEAGKFGLYFAPGAPLVFDNWQVPKELDWGAWPITQESAQEVTFERDMELVNYQGSKLALKVVRSVRLLGANDIAQSLGRSVPAGVAGVAYASDNRVTNIGADALRKETGLISIWILGMFPPGARATVVIPYRAEAEGELVRDDYFGKVPPDRLRVADKALFFRADGKQRGKVGVPFARAKSVIGSYDPEGHVLTLVQYSLPEGKADYVNSLWKFDVDPYAGDVVNSYNDGPTTPGGSPLGPFYELETSSPAGALGKGETFTHVSRTFHFTGEESGLDELARALLGVGIKEIEAALD